MATQVEVDDEGNEHPLRVTGELLADAVIESVSNGISKVDEINGEIIHGNLMEKLKKLHDTKNTIAYVIENLGVTIPDNATFAQYPQLIAEILTVITGSLLDNLNVYADQLIDIIGNVENQEEENE